MTLRLGVKRLRILRVFLAFLDELPGFQRNVLEVMRQPLEEGSVTMPGQLPLGGLCVLSHKVVRYSPTVVTRTLQGAGWPRVLTLW